MSALVTTELSSADRFVRHAYTIIDDIDWASISATMIRKSLAIIGLLILGLVIRWILHRLVDRMVGRAEDGVLPAPMRRLSLGSSAARQYSVAHPGSTRRVQRVRTMGGLFKSIISGVVFAVIGTMMLGQLGLNIAPIIASAGIIGIALGFGAQSLVKDYLSGMFMIFEDQYGVGDVVDLGEAVGTVEAVSLRVTRVRDVNGTVWYVRNGEIIRVGNQSQNWARTVLDISVDYHEDLVRVQRILREVAHDLWDDDDFKGVIIEEPEIWGVQDLRPDAIAVRVTLKTAPLEQWRVAREMRERIKARFDYEGITFPAPLRVSWQQQPPTGGPPDGLDPGEDASESSVRSDAPHEGASSTNEDGEAAVSDPRVSGQGA